jgi:hypothetical protein
VAAKAVRKGFYGEGQTDWAISYSAKELHDKVNGSTEVNWKEMKRSSIFRGYFGDDIPITLFWQVFDELEEEAKSAMLQFITASKRAPAKGFRTHPLTFVKVGWDPITRRPPPRAHTCFRTLDLPEITDVGTMRDMVRLCITYSEGFGLE